MVNGALIPWPFRARQRISLLSLDDYVIPDKASLLLASPPAFAELTTPGTFIPLGRLQETITRNSTACSERTLTALAISQPPSSGNQQAFIVHRQSIDTYPEVRYS